MKWWPDFVRWTYTVRLFFGVLLYGSNTFSRPAISRMRPGVILPVLHDTGHFSWTWIWSRLGWWVRHKPHTIEQLRPHDQIVRFLTRHHWMPHQLGVPLD